MELLKELCSCPSVSGSESEIIEVIKNKIPECYSVKTDIHGSLIAQNSGEGKGIMFVCAVDTEGFYVTYIDRRGFLYFSSAGEIEAKNHLGRKVTFKNGRNGIICEDTKKEEFFIDAGFKDDTNAQNFVQISDYAALTTDFCEMGDFAAGYKVGKNAAICAMLSAMQKKTDKNAYFVFLTKSAINQTSFEFLKDIDIDFIVTVGGSAADDLPKNECPPIKPGKAVIKIKDKSMLCSKEVIKALESGGAELQREVSDDKGLGNIQREFGGRKCGGVGIPVRYKDTQSEAVLLSDIEKVAELIGNLL